jgi:hypothetical protein
MSALTDVMPVSSDDVSTDDMSASTDVSADVMPTSTDVSNGVTSIYSTDGTVDIIYGEDEVAATFVATRTTTNDVVSDESFSMDITVLDTTTIPIVSAGHDMEYIMTIFNFSIIMMILMLVLMLMFLTIKRRHQKGSRSLQPRRPHQIYRGADVVEFEMETI